MEISFVQLTFLVRETLKPVCITLKGHVYCRRIDVPHAWEDRDLAIRLQIHLPGPHPALQSPILTGHILGIMTCSLNNWNTDSSGSSICSLSQWEVVPKEDRWQPEVTNLEVFVPPRADSDDLRSGSGDGNFLMCPHTLRCYVQECHSTRGYKVQCSVTMPF